MPEKLLLRNITVYLYHLNDEAAFCKQAKVFFLNTNDASRVLSGNTLSKWSQLTLLSLLCIYIQSSHVIHETAPQLAINKS